ncbi:MAG: helix-turn-helix transcriptional regulator [Desulfotalea sp.]
MKKHKWIDVAKWLNVKKSYLSRIVNGSMRPSPKRALVLMDISGISLEDWLLLDTELLKIEITAAYEDCH